VEGSSSGRGSIPSSLFAEASGGGRRRTTEGRYGHERKGSMGMNCYLRAVVAACCRGWARWSCHSEVTSGAASA